MNNWPLNCLKMRTPSKQSSQRPTVSSSTTSASRPKSLALFPVRAAEPSNAADRIQPASPSTTKMADVIVAWTRCTRPRPRSVVETALWLAPTKSASLDIFTLFTNTHFILFTRIFILDFNSAHDEQQLFIQGENGIMYILFIFNKSPSILKST